MLEQDPGGQIRRATGLHQAPEFAYIDACNGEDAGFFVGEPGFFGFLVAPHVHLPLLVNPLGRVSLGCQHLTALPEASSTAQEVPAVCHA